MLTIIGDLGYDINITEKGERYLIGGSGYHTMLGAIAASGISPAFISCVGYDFELLEIEKLKVNLDYIIKDGTKKTTRFINEYRNNSRNVSIEMGASERICFECLDNNILTSDIIHFSTTHPIKQMKYVQLLKRNGYRGKISIDVFDEFCKKYFIETMTVFEESDIVFMNNDEKNILDISINEFDKLYIIKHGKDGAECYFNNLYFKACIKCNQCEVIDTTGAGDILAGAFLALLDKNTKLDYALSKSVALATESVKFFGSQYLLELTKEAGNII